MWSRKGEDWTVVTHVVSVLFLREAIHIVWRDLEQEINVFICVELGHLVFRSRFRTLIGRTLASLRGV